MVLFSRQASGASIEPSPGPVSLDALESRTLLTTLIGSEAPAFTALGPVTQVVTADLNRDGRNDLIVGEATSPGATGAGRIAFYLSGAGGLRRLARTITPSTAAERIEVGKLRPDDAPTYLALGQSANIVRLLRVSPGGVATNAGQVDLSVLLAGTIPDGTDRFITDLAFADVTGDGLAELLVLHTGGSPSYLSVFRINEGAGSISLISNTELGTGAETIVTGKLNLDSADDVLVGFGFPTTTVTSLLTRNDGTGRFNVSTFGSGQGGYPSQLLLLQFNMIPEAGLVVGFTDPLQRSIETWNFDRLTGEWTQDDVEPENDTRFNNGSVVQFFNINFERMASSREALPGVVAYADGVARYFGGSTGFEPLLIAPGASTPTFFIADLNNDLVPDIGGFRPGSADVVFFANNSTTPTRQFIVSPSFAQPGSTVQFAAYNVTPATPGASVRSVEFYRDSNGDGRFNANLDVRFALDTSGANGWGVARQIGPLWARGDQAVWYRTIDSLGRAGAVVRALLTVGVARPLVTSLSPNQVFVAPGRTAALTIGVSATAGRVVQVRAFIDRNGDGTFQTTERVGGRATNVTEEGPINIRLGFRAPANLMDGTTYRLYVQVQDEFGLWSLTRSTFLTTPA